MARRLPPRAGRAGRPWLRLRRAVLADANHICQLRLDGCTVRATAVDHIVARSKAPELAETRSNLIAACGPCNRKKSTLSLREARERFRPEPKTREWT